MKLIELHFKGIVGVDNDNDSERIKINEKESIERGEEGENCNDECYTLGGIAAINALINLKTCRKEDFVIECDNNVQIRVWGLMNNYAVEVVYCGWYIKSDKLLCNTSSVHRIVNCAQQEINKVILADNTKMEQLARLRLAAGWTQQELSERSGVPVISITRYETGTRHLYQARVDTVKKIAEALRCTIEDLA